MSTTVIHTIEHDIGIDGVLEIRLGDGDVRLRGIDGTTVRVSGDPGDALDGLLALDRGAGSLSIRPDRRGDFGEGWHAGRTPDLAIDAPRGATLVVDSSGGDITAESFTGEQRYRSASGDIRLRGVTGRLTVEALSGDVDATITGKAAISARTVSGDLALRAATIATLRATTTSGDIRLAGQLDGAGPFTIESVSGDALLALAGDVRVDLQTVAGDLRSEVPGRSESRPGKRSMTIGSGGSTLSVRTMSGDVRIVRAGPVTRDERAAALAQEAPPTIVVTHDPEAKDEVPDLTDAAADARLAILRALERGGIDVAEATRRLEALASAGEPETDPAATTAIVTDDAPTEITTDDRATDDRATDGITTDDSANDDTATNAAPATTEEATDA